MWLPSDSDSDWTVRRQDPNRPTAFQSYSGIPIDDMNTKYFFNTDVQYFSSWCRCSCKQDSESRRRREREAFPLERDKREIDHQVTVTRMLIETHFWQVPIPFHHEGVSLSAGGGDSHSCLDRQQSSKPLRSGTWRHGCHLEHSGGSQSDIPEMYCYFSQS